MKAKDMRNKEIAVEHTIADTKEQIKKVDITEAKFSNEREFGIRIFNLRPIQRI